jgi:hypothetical protein
MNALARKRIRGAVRIGDTGGGYMNAPARKRIRRRFFPRRAGGR